MKYILSAAALAALAACTSTPGPGADLLGKWACESKVEQTTIKADITYLAGGAAGLAVTIAGAGDVAFEAKGAGEGTWALSADGTQLDEKITKLTVTSAKANGNDIPPALAQAFVDPALPDLSATTKIELSPGRLVKTMPDGAVTICTR